MHNLRNCISSKKPYVYIRTSRTSLALLVLYQKKNVSLLVLITWQVLGGLWIRFPNLFPACEIDWDKKHSFDHLTLVKIKEWRWLSFCVRAAFYLCIYIYILINWAFQTQFQLSFLTPFTGGKNCLKNPWFDSL